MILIMKKENRKYTPKYFKIGLPKWKRIKDPFTSRIIYRPLSFVTASIAANCGISANTVSYISIFIAILACIFIAIPNLSCNIIGSIFVNLWLLFDCTDGNLARSVKKQPFGTFADSVSSYILVAFLCTSLGISAYFNGGLLVEKNCIWIVFLGCLASSADTLMRLIYQKYKSTERLLIDNKLLKDEKEKREDQTQTNSLIVRIESDFGVGGILPILILLGVMFNMIDVVVIYCFIYYFFASLLMITKYIIKAIKKTHEIENNERR